MRSSSHQCKICGSGFSTAQVGGHPFIVCEKCSAELDKTNNAETVRERMTIMDSTNLIPTLGWRTGVSIDDTTKNVTIIISFRLETGPVNYLVSIEEALALALKIFEKAARAEELKA